MASDEAGNKTEPATPRQRDEARKKGRVARSNEVGSAAVLLSGVVFLMLMGSTIREGLCDVYRMNLGGLPLGELNAAGVLRIIRRSLAAGLMPFLPVILGLVAVTAFANYCQVGFRVTWETVAPKFDNLSLNPAAAFKKFVSLKSMMTLGTSAVKLAAILFVGYITVKSHLPAIVGLHHATPAGVASTVARAALDLGLRAALLMLVIAAIDYAYQRWQYERDLKMTKEEVKEERKLLEGSPETRSRIRRVQTTLARNRMMNDVKKADVVVRNPTHYAVALKYDPQKAGAPMVLAKGARYLAERILELAKQHKVPTVRDAPLAQALYKSVEVGGLIPLKLFNAVARLLVQVYRQRGRRLPGVD